MWYRRGWAVLTVSAAGMSPPSSAHTLHSCLHLPLRCLNLESADSPGISAGDSRNPIPLWAGVWVSGAAFTRRRLRICWGALVVYFPIWLTFRLCGKGGSRARLVNHAGKETPVALGQLRGPKWENSGEDRRRVSERRLSRFVFYPEAARVRWLRD